MSFMGKKKNLLTLLFILLAMPLIAQEMIVKGNVMSTDNETLVVRRFLLKVRRRELPPILMETILFQLKKAISWCFLI